MGQYHTPNSTHLKMKVLSLALLLSVHLVSGADLRSHHHPAPPSQVEYGFCDNSPEPFTFDLLSIEPFPIIVQNGALVTIAAQVTLSQVIEVGTKVSLSLVLEGFIPIKIPCLDLDGVNIGSCTYDGDELLASSADILCPSCSAPSSPSPASSCPS